jgi:hypothetical protein
MADSPDIIFKSSSSDSDSDDSGDGSDINSSIVELVFHVVEQYNNWNTAVLEYQQVLAAANLPEQCESASQLDVKLMLYRTALWALYKDNDSHDTPLTMEYTNIIEKHKIAMHNLDSFNVQKSLHKIRDNVGLFYDACHNLKTELAAHSELEYSKYIAGLHTDITLKICEVFQFLDDTNEQIASLTLKCCATSELKDKRAVLLAKYEMESAKLLELMMKRDDLVEHSAASDADIDAQRHITKELHKQLNSIEML